MYAHMKEEYVMEGGTLSDAVKNYLVSVVEMTPGQIKNIGKIMIEEYSVTV